MHELCERIHVSPAEFVTQMIATRFAPLEANNNRGDAEGGGGGAVRRRRRSAGEPPPWGALCAEVIAAAAECAAAVTEIDAAVASSNSSSCSIDGWGRVELALGASAAPERLSTLGEYGPKVAEDLAGGYAAAVGNLTAAHVIESWIVQLFGAAEIFAEIRELASALRTSLRRPLQRDAG